MSGLTRTSFLSLNNQDPNEFILYPMPGNFYQFYYAPLEDKLISNNYNSQADGSYKWSGTGQLYRGEATCSWLSEYSW